MNIGISLARAVKIAIHPAKLAWGQKILTAFHAIFPKRFSITNAWIPVLRDFSQILIIIVNHVKFNVLRALGHKISV